MDPFGGRPRTYSKVGHRRLFTKALVFWEPHQDERASCCTNKKATRSTPLALFTHCKTRTHLDRLSREKLDTLKVKLERLLVPIEVFDLLEAPLLLNHGDLLTRKVAQGTLKGSYK